MRAGLPQDTPMTYLRESDLTVDQLSDAIVAAAESHGFGVLHQYDFQQILEKKGFPIDARCRVFEICNPRQASEVLAVDMALNMALPCRVSVYEQGGRTVVGMIPPTELLALVSDDDAIAASAREVEAAMQAMIDALATGGAG
ncbi:DUF302 domain-containing protein [Luteimonas vadosa]|uniref:DUF302 domain-containing protein n=1 Tax=Luteimonas vadosa TaxID=1165507 RepID=A0ABP9E3A6_9GAMM